MSLNADPVLGLAAGPETVRTALKRAGEATGAGFELLYNMARRESSLNPAAEAKTSSAAGLFQFIEETWLSAVKKYGPKHGLDAAAADITVGDDGRARIADPERRKEILDFRFDPAKAAALAGELAQENRAGLEKRLGRAIKTAEIYAAHFLGVGGAAKLLAAAPDAKAADILPKAAAANRPVFFGAGGAKSVADVIASMERSMGAVASRPTAPAPEPQTRPVLQSAGAFVAPLRQPSAAEAVFASRAVSETPASAPPLRAQSDDVAGENRLRLLEVIGPAWNSGALTPLAIAVLQSLDPAKIGKTGSGEREPFEGLT